MNPISAALTLWERGLASSEAVIAWADEELLKSEVPSRELIDLSLNGPEACIRHAQEDFPARPYSLTYEEALGLRAMFLDLSSIRAVSDFTDWASRSCMGNDLSSEVVQFGYQLDHLICDCDDKAAAMAIVRNRLPEVGSSCSSTAERILAAVPNLVLKNGRVHR